MVDLLFSTSPLFPPLTLLLSLLVPTKLGTPRESAGEATTPRALLPIPPLPSLSVSSALHPASLRTFSLLRLLPPTTRRGGLSPPPRHLMPSAKSYASSPSRLSLLSPLELSEWMDSASPPLLLEASHGANKPEAHIPGAVLVYMEQIDLYHEEAPGRPARVHGNYNLKPSHELKAALEAAGVTASRPTVVYTQSFKQGAAEPIVAARLAWALAYAGVEHVLLLGGGMHAWREAGLSVSTTPSERPRNPPDFFFGYDASIQEANVANDAPSGVTPPFPRNPHYLAATPDVHAAIRSCQPCEAATGGACAAVSENARQAILADVRSWREFVGEGHDYPFDLPHGRIPTARWAQWGPSTYVGGDFFSPMTGALLPLSHVRALWHGPQSDLFGTASGKDALANAQAAPARVIFYCGSGWRSSLAWCLARLMGYEDCANYDGGFLEWSMLHPDAESHPIVTGVERS